jgi:hypothetical protein
VLSVKGWEVSVKGSEVLAVVSVCV